MKIEAVADGLWLLRYPLRLLGLPIGRNVAVIRLRSGRLVIHSTAPFTPHDVAEISKLGQPAWLTDVSRFHDSFAENGRAAFPDVTYLVPDGFSKGAALHAESLDLLPAEWNDELKVMEIGGMPSVREYAFLHVASRTLIVADLMFNFGAHASPFTRFVARHLLRLADGVGMSPFFRLMIRDRAAFDASLREILDWNFDRIIVGHGETIECGGKSLLRKLIR